MFALDARAETSVSGNATLTSDYVWRGISQTQEDPAAQAGVKVADNSGFYASVWGSTVRSDAAVHANSEFDFTAGWTGPLAEDWALDVNVLHYRYPSTSVDLNWTELNGTLTWKDRYWVSMGYSPEALGSDDDGLYTQVGARVPLAQRFRVEGAVGYYRLDQGPIDSYLHGQLSAIWTIKAPVEVRATLHATDADAKRLFGHHLAGSRVEVALQSNF